MGYFGSTLCGVGWMGAFRASSRAVAFVRVAIVARILTPAEFGLFSIATLVLAFLEILTETGINVFLIQEEGELKNYLNTAWVVSIARGIAISLLLLLVAPYIASFFNSPNAAPLLYLAALVPLIRGFINPSEVIYQKELAFRKEFWFRFAIFSFDSLVAVLATLITKSAIGLIIGLVAGAILELILSFVIFSLRPVIAFEKEKLTHVINRGKWVTAGGVFEYLFYNLDNVVVGRILGSAALALYQNAYRISTLPISEITDVFGKVTFPTYSKISSEKDRLKRAFIKTNLLIALVAIPFGILVSIFAKEIVLVVLGEAWISAAGALRILAIFGAIKAITNHPYSLFLSLKKQEYLTVTTLVGIVGLGVTIVPFVKAWGIIGAGYSALLGTLATVPVMFYFTLRIFSNAKN